MDILEQLRDIKSVVMTYEDHPVNEMDLEFKLHYINGVAIMMNVDGEIVEQELSYLKRLINSFDLPIERLDELIEFSKNRSNNAVIELLNAISESGDIKLVFMFDCLSLANSDGKFHKNENEMIQLYREMLKVDKNIMSFIENLEETTRQENHNALCGLFLNGDSDLVIIFDYLRSFFQLDFESEKRKAHAKYREILDFQFSEMYGDASMLIQGSEKKRPKRKSGETEVEPEEGEKKVVTISRFPVLLSHLAIFLQDYEDQEKLFHEKEMIFEQSSGSLLINLEDSQLEYSVGKYSFSKNTNATGLTSMGIELFINWVNDIINYEVGLLTFGRAPVKWGDSIYIWLKNISYKFPEYCNLGHQMCQFSLMSQGMGDTGNYDQKYYVDNLSTIFTDYTDSSTVFRLVKLYNEQSSSFYFQSKQKLIGGGK